MGKNQAPAKKVVKVNKVTMSVKDQETTIKEIFEDVVAQLKNARYEQRDDEMLCNWITKQVKAYFDKPLEAYVPGDWKSENVWHAVINKIIKYRNTNRQTKNNRRIKQKKVNLSFSIKRFYTCLHCWKEIMYIYIV